MPFTTAVPRRSLPIVGAIVTVMATDPVCAQGVGTVVGTVTMVGDGVPGVRVQMPVLGLETIADIDGRFRFDFVTAGSHELRAEAIGCRASSWTVDVPEGGDVQLRLLVEGPAISAPSVGRPSGNALSPSAIEPAYAVERLSAADMKRNPSRHVADLIRGAFPGVRIVQGSGLPGSSLSIQFRGPKSLSGDQAPLVVVDGAITGGGLDDLDPFDIEDLVVLKGSAAAAMYGARGQSGVIEITTKSGMATDGARCFLRRDPSS